MSTIESKCVQCGHSFLVNFPDRAEAGTLDVERAWKDGFVAALMQMTTWPEVSARSEADRQYARLAGAEE